ncbi:hypothetical protein DSO57_1026129 [Entomophthora muscae]|uniref:Uncharacterized protein n=1 Tax=Entomophthora muscae TaxID=34485 RepID=A0ACC2U163_9FUNG|nr:hypothetical protein DSO57_1026129 [Entomophthora muscae]
MYCNGAKVVELPKKKLHFINMEYAESDIPVAYTLQHRKLRMLPLSTKEYKGIPLYASSMFTIPSGSQVIHHTSLSLEIPSGLHGEVLGYHDASCLCQNCRLNPPARFQPSRFVTCNPIIWPLEARLGSQLELPNPTT